MSQFNDLKDCRYGKMIYNKNDMYIGKSLELYGEYSEGEIDIFRQLIHQGDTVLEVGSNLGAHTLALAQLVGKLGQVHAFDPQRLVFQTLAGNMALNSLTNVYCYQKAVGETHGQIKVPVLDYEHEVNWGGLELGKWDYGETVDLITIDSLNLSGCHFIKINVEGMELNVLKGAVKTIERFLPILYVENDRQEKSQELIGYLHSLEYNLHWHQPLLFNEKNFFNNPENVFSVITQKGIGGQVIQNIVSINMLCLPRKKNIKVQGFSQVEVR